MCAEPIADEHQHVVNVEGRQLMCICRGCYLLFTDPARQAALPRGPGPLPRVPGLRAGPPPVGGTADPGRAGVLLPQLRRSDRTVAFYPGPAGRHRVRTGPGGLERRCRAADPRAGHARRRRRGAAGAGARRTDPATPRRAIWCPIDACYEFVGRLRMLWRGFDGGQEARRVHRRLLRRRRRRAARWRSRHDRGDVHGAATWRPSRTR